MSLPSPCRLHNRAECDEGNLAARFSHRHGFDQPQHEAVLDAVAASTASVLISGESGVGKERVALKLHGLGKDARQRPFIAVNCGALIDTSRKAGRFRKPPPSLESAAKTCGKR